MLAGLPREDVILTKSSGEEIILRAHVQPKLIFVEDSSANIEEDDVFTRILPNGNQEYYRVLDRGFYGATGGIAAHYQVKVEKLKEMPVLERKEAKQRIIFISHSSKDKEYTKAFVDLLFDIGLNEDDIVCSSYPGIGVPLRASVYEWLVEKFQEYDLHVLYFLSHNYYQSAASLNEMGAAWAMKQKWDGILLPGFNFSEIAGCIDPNQIQIKLDGEIEELRHRLGELKDDIVTEFGLRTVSPTRWEKIRNEFIDKVEKIVPVEEAIDAEYTPTPISDRGNSISVYACIMLMYASEDDGQVIVSPSLGNTSYQAGRFNMERSQNPRELALWDDAVSQLVGKGYIKKIGRKDLIYQVTAEGYSIADAFKEQNNLDPSKEPEEILAGFGEGI